MQKAEYINWLFILNLAKAYNADAFIQTKTKSMVLMHISLSK